MKFLFSKTVTIHIAINFIWYSYIIEDIRVKQKKKSQQTWRNRVIGVYENHRRNQMSSRNFLKWVNSFIELQKTLWNRCYLQLWYMVLGRCVEWWIEFIIDSLDSAAMNRDFFSFTWHYLIQHRQWYHSVVSFQWLMHSYVRAPLHIHMERFCLCNFMAQRIFVFCFQSSPFFFSLSVLLITTHW